MKLFVNLANSSNQIWPSLASADGKNRLRLIAYWTKDGTQVGNFVETTLPYDFQPGDEAILPLTIRAPASAGEYTLKVQLTDEANLQSPANGKTALELRVHVVE